MKRSITVLVLVLLLPACYSIDPELRGHRIFLTDPVMGSPVLQDRPRTHDPEALRQARIEARMARLESRLEEILLLANQLADPDGFPEGRRDEKIRALEKLIEEEKARIEARKRKIAELAKMLHEQRWSDRRPEEARVASVPMGPNPPMPLPTPKGLDPPGSVVGVSSRVNLVVINIGQDQGVKKGDRFVVLRGSAPIGSIEVERTYPRQSACRASLRDPNEPMEPGDRVYPESSFR